MGSESAISRETLPEEKKRKKKKEKQTAREEEGSSPPPPPLPVQAKVEAVGEQPGKLPPLVGYFPSGFDPLKVRDGPGSTRVRVFRNKTRTNRLQLVVSPSGSQMEFVGSSYSGEATAGQMCTYALGVLDKETQTLKVVPIAANKIFRMEPRGGRLGSQLGDKESLEVDAEENAAEKSAAKMRDLTNRYGTKKAITQAKKLQALYQKEDPETQALMDQKVKDVAINKEALENTTESNVFRNIPPYDSTATTPQEAYPLDKIIQKGDWPYLQDIFYEQGKSSVDAYPVFVRNRLHKLEDMQDHEEKQTMACIFQFIAHLLKFKDKHSMDGVSSAKDHAIPSLIFMKFSSLFPVTESRRLPDEKIDLLISYVLVLTLHADGFRTDPSDIAKDLRMSPLTLRQHLEVLGCKLSSKNKITYATLSAPLKFPVLRKRRRRG